MSGLVYHLFNSQNSRLHQENIDISSTGSAEKRNNGQTAFFFTTANHHLSVSSASESQLSMFISSNQVRERWCYSWAEQLGRLIWPSQRRWCILSLSISVYRVSSGSRSRTKDKANGEWIQGSLLASTFSWISEYFSRGSTGGQQLTNWSATILICLLIWGCNEV